MAPPHILDYLPYLAFTWAVELPLVVLIFRRRCGLGRSVVAGLVASGVTHPLLWYVWPLFVPPYTFTLWLRYVISGELLVVVIEALIFLVVVLRGAGDWSWRRRLLVALGASALVNAASLGLGMLSWLL